LPTDVSLKFVSFHIDSLPIVNTQHKRNVRFHPRAKAQGFPAPENYNKHDKKLQGGTGLDIV